MTMTMAGTGKDGREYPTIPEIFERTVRRHGEKLAIAAPPPEGIRAGLVGEYAEITYRELQELSDRVASGLARRGIKPDDKVAILSRPRPEMAAAILGIHKAGAVAVPLDPLLQAAEIHRLLTQTDSVAALVSGELLPRVEGLATLQFLVALDPVEKKPKRVLAWEEFLSDAPPPLREVSPEDLAVLLCTSGTTGDAKAVMLTHRNLTSNVEGVLERLDVSHEDVVISIAPWNHSFGLITLLTVLRVGATIVWTNDYANLAQIMTRYRATILVAVPKLYHAMYERVMGAIEESRVRSFLSRVAPRVIGWQLKRKMAGGRLRFFASGSAPLSPHVIEGFRRLGVGMIEGYGMTEASPVLTFSTPFNDKPGSVGPPLPNVELRLLNPNEEGIGELLARGPNIMRGYYKNPERTREVLDEEGWLHTGDLAYIDEDGWVYIKGRCKSVIVLDTGKNVYPEEIEWELSHSPYIEEILVRAGRRKGMEVIQALVYPNWEAIGKPLPKEEVRRLIWQEIRKHNENLAQYKRIKSEQDVIIVDQPFEKTSLKDIKRFLYVDSNPPSTLERGQEQEQEQEQEHAKNDDTPRAGA